MRGLDTNVLVGCVLDGQVEPLPGRGPYRVSLVVLAELVWVLSRTFRRPKPEVLVFLDVLTTIDDIRFDKPAVVAAAIKDWAEGPADFPDYLLMRDHASTGAAMTLTRDRKAAKHSGFELLA